MATTITYVDPATATYTKGAEYLRVNGSDYAGRKQVKGSGLDLDTPDTPISYPIIQDSALSDSQEQSTLNSEGGTVYTLAGNVTVTLSMTILQSDGNTIITARTERGLYYQIVKKMNDIPLDGKYYFLVIPSGQAQHSIEGNGVNPTIPLLYGCNKTEVDTTVDFSEYDSIFPNIDFSLSTTPETMTKGQSYYIFEVTV